MKPVPLPAIISGQNRQHRLVQKPETVLKEVKMERGKVIEK